MLKYWYSHLQCAVLWKGVLGNIFNITRGVTQRGVLLAIRVKLILVPIFGNFMEVSTIL